MPTTPSDQRRHTRYPLNRPVFVVNTVSSERLGTLVNVSEEGLMVFGDQPVRDGHVFQVNVTDEATSEHILYLGIECLWTNDADTESKIWSGYRIIDISDTDKELLSALIAQLM